MDVVVVDDADDVRAIVTRYLRLSGSFDVVGEGSDGADAVALAAAHHPTLMVLDASMPGVGGVEAIPKVLEQSPGTTVVIFSGFSAPALGRAARAAGAADVIDKSTPVDALPERLLGLLSAEPQSPGAADAGEDTDADVAQARRLERFRLLVEGVRDYAIFMLDPPGRVSTWNPGAERMKGYRADEIIGRHFRAFYEPEDQAAGHPEHNLEVAAGTGRCEEEGWRVRKDGSRFWADVVITALFADDGGLLGFAKVTRDITERRTAVQALEASNRRLADVASQTAEFAAMIVHELRSPIAAMTGAATTLRDFWDSVDERDRRQMLESLLRGGGRLQRLVDDLLVVARLEAGAFEFALERLELRGVIDEAVSARAGSLGPIAVDCPDRLEVLADPMRCAQMLGNLLDNAEAHGEPPVSIRASRGGTSAIVEVHDAGTELEEVEGARLFEKFAQGRRRRSDGSGLGLYIVRELARGQGGDAWCRSDRAGTTTFAFSLPLA